jgi:hypothetical protein
MKKYVTFFLLMLFAGKTFSQVDTSTSHTSLKTDYLKKSKTQKTIAWILLGTGTTLIVIGSSIGTHGVEDLSYNEAAAGAGFIIAGALMDIGSIPLFIAGAKNKRRAMSVTINNELIPRLQQGMIARVPMPTIGLRVRL